MVVQLYIMNYDGSEQSLIQDTYLQMNISNILFLCTRRNECSLYRMTYSYLTSYLDDDHGLSYIGT